MQSVQTPGDESRRIESLDVNDFDKPGMFGAVRCAGRYPTGLSAGPWSVYTSGFFEQPDIAQKEITTLLNLAAGNAQAFVQAIPLLKGHFGIAISDGIRVHLIADRFGTRPIYYAPTEAGWVWSFTLRELLPHLSSRTIDDEGLLEIFCIAGS